MLFRLSVSLLFMSGVAATGRLTAPSFVENDGVTLELFSKFRSWVSFHEKEYDSGDEKSRRMQIWMENNERIEAHNNQEPPPSYTLGHNAFSDMTQDEFAQLFKLGKYSDFQKKEQIEASLADESIERVLLDVDMLELPKSVNWVEMGAVTDVKNQGSCGACWAFSTTGALEGARFIKTGELVSLSEQNLLDCDHKDLGCRGGLMDNAFKFDEKSGGLCSEADYPYSARQGTCNTDCEDVPGTIVKSFVDVPPGNQKALMAALAMQPVSVAIEADQLVFQFYKKGVISNDTCGKHANIDHGVLAVGYDTDPDTEETYFLVKNSWGPTWGEDGYVRIGRTTANKYGICAITKLASFPTLE